MGKVAVITMKLRIPKYLNFPSRGITHACMCPQALFQITGVKLEDECLGKISQESAAITPR